MNLKNYICIHKVEPNNQNRTKPHISAYFFSHFGIIGWNFTPTCVCLSAWTCMHVLFESMRSAIIGFFWTLETLQIVFPKQAISRSNMFYQNRNASTIYFSLKKPNGKKSKVQNSKVIRYWLHFSVKKVLVSYDPNTSTCNLFQIIFSLILFTSS